METKTFEPPAFMTALEWDVALAPNIPWQNAYALVEKSARLHLLHNPKIDGDTLSTAAFVEIIYAESSMRGDAGLYARRRIFKALAALATRGLSDCCTRGPEKHIGRTKRTGRPWFWHAPTAPNAEARAPSDTDWLRRATDLLRESLDAWQGEEDSVKEEKAEHIADLEKFFAEFEKR